MLYQDNLPCRQYKTKFCQRQTHCIDDKINFILLQDNEFTECQTPRKQIQSIGISPFSLHASMKTLESNISEAYKVQADCLKSSESDSYNKNDVNEKVNDLVRQCNKN